VENLRVYCIYGCGFSSLFLATATGLQTFKAQILMPTLQSSIFPVLM